MVWSNIIGSFEVVYPPWVTYFAILMLFGGIIASIISIQYHFAIWQYQDYYLRDHDLSILLMGIWVFTIGGLFYSLTLISAILIGDEFLFVAIAISTLLAIAIAYLVTHICFGFGRSSN